MAPVRESSYFPPLDRCLDGRSQLLSWTTTCLGLEQLDRVPTGEVLERHLTDSQTLDFLKQSLAPLPTPSAHSKSAFETKTSAVNVPSSTQGRYDIKQIQGDALWLSAEANIDEVAALRLVVLEQQTRPVAQLQELSQADDVSFVGGSSIGSRFQPTFAASRSALLTKTSPDDDEFIRRTRFFSLYLAERQHRLKACKYFVVAALNRSGAGETHQIQRSKPSPRWAEELGSEILTAWGIAGTSQPGDKDVVKSGIDALRSRIHGLEQGSGWFRERGLQEPLEAMWCEGQILEMVVVLEILLIIFAALEQLPHPSGVIAWFRLMSDYAFFEHFEPPFREFYETHQTELQFLVSLASLAVLRLPSALNLIRSFSAATDSAEKLDGLTPYLFDFDACSEITEILVSAASECARIASPAILAWSILLQALREQAYGLREGNDNHQSMLANDRSGAVDFSNNERVERARVRSTPSNLRRQSSTGSDTPQQQNFLEQLLDKVMLVPVDGDPIAYLARAAVDGSKVLSIIGTLASSFCNSFDYDHAFMSTSKTIFVLMDLVRASLRLIDYQPDLLEATLSVLAGSAKYSTSIGQQQVKHIYDTGPADVFLNDDLFMTRLFFQAHSRFPYEVLPFLKLCRALACAYEDQTDGMPLVWSKLTTSDSLTCILPANFTDYQLLPEDEESSIIQLTANLDLSRSGRSLGTATYGRPKQARNLNLHQIPHGAVGRALSETKPLVVLWQHSYSIMAYLGMLLGLASSKGPTMGSSPYSSNQPPEVIAEIIDLLTTMLLTASKAASIPNASLSALEATQSLLDSAEEGLSPGQDIVSVIFDTFEHELGRQNKSTEEDHMSLLTCCVRFAQALLPVMPDRVWPFLGRNGLVDIKDGDSLLNAVLTSPEIAPGKCKFLIRCIHLYQSLIENALSQALTRKVPDKIVTRFAAPRPLNIGVSQVVMRRVLLGFQRIMLDVYENNSTWNYIEVQKRFEINALLSTIFDHLLKCCFGIGDPSHDPPKLVASLMPAAEQTLNTFLQKSGAEPTANLLTSMNHEGIVEARTMEPQHDLMWKDQTLSALKLSATLLRLNTMLGYPRSYLEGHYMRCVSLLARSYTGHPAFRQPTIELLDVLVHSADLTDGQPGSLLGHIGEAAANAFLEVLALIDEPVCDRHLSVSIWKFLSAIVSKRQQWFAVFVLTGKASRKVLRRNESERDGNGPRHSILNVALDKVSIIGKLHPEIAVAILEFVALSADSWPWILAIFEQHSSFLPAISDYVAHAETVLNTTHNRSIQDDFEYLRLQILSYITEILAMYAHHARQTNKNSFAKDLLPNLTYIIKAAITPPEYNASLHSKLRQNFEATYQDLALADLRRSALSPPPLGASFFYSIDIASQALGFDPNWVGKDQRGFAAELARANINLSSVEARINLFHSWKYLAVELMRSLGAEVHCQEMTAGVIVECLRANAQTTLPQLVFERLAQSRVDLAFTLLQGLIDRQSTRPEVKSILFTAWDAQRAYGTDLAAVLSGDRAPYGRTLLKVICLSIQAQVSPRTIQDPADHGTSRVDSVPTRTSAADATLRTVLEVLRMVVAHGFRALTMLLHDAPHHVLPEDFALLAAILRNTLCIPGLERHTTALLSIFADAQASRYASTLLSWSDQLATNRDPVYGELSINFLLEMSTMPALAETLAVEGILTRVSNTNLIRQMRTLKALSPFDQPTRLYNIWVRGILPLLLNLLHAVGASIAAEIAAVLSQFSGQLSRASKAFTYYRKASMIDGQEPNAAGYITLSMVSEAQTLAVITSILNAYREAGPSAGVVSAEIVETGWDRMRVKEDVETLLQQKESLRERIISIGEREEGWLQLKPSGDGRAKATNQFEEKVVQELELLLMLLGGSEE
ncbi:MAG: hypothetical protein Q9220_006477 [cf. Caloplaca sp. 1 TL-2023]